MKKTGIILFLSVSLCRAQQLYFPPLSGNQWDTISPASLGWCTDKIEPMHNYIGNNDTKAFIVLKSGKIAIEKYYGTFTSDSMWYWASAGKTLTALAVGIAKQEGLLKLSDTTSSYLGSGWTSCTPAQEKAITIRHQLSMSSGLDDGVADPYCTLSSCLSYKADAGTRWAYHNAPYTLLDKVIEAASGQNLSVFVQQRIKSKTGMNGVFLPSGYNNVFFSTPRSMARFGLLMLNKGSWNGTPVLSDSLYFSEMINTSQSYNKSYGYLTWLNGRESFMVPGLQLVFPGNMMPNGPADLYMALGKNGQFINVVPSQQLVFIRMGNAPGGSEVPLQMNDTIWQKLKEVMCTPTNLNKAERNEENIRVYYQNEEHKILVETSLEYFSVSLINMQGVKVSELASGENRAEINTAGMPAEIYFLLISSASGKNYQRKVVCD